MARQKIGRSWSERPNTICCSLVPCLKSLIRSLLEAGSSEISRSFHRLHRFRQTRKLNSTHPTAAIAQVLGSGTEEKAIESK